MSKHILTRIVNKMTSDKTVLTESKAFSLSITHLYYYIYCEIQIQYIYQTQGHACHKYSHDRGPIGPDQLILLI